MDQTIHQLKQYRATVIFEKKKHYNAADRKKNYHVSMQIVIVFFSVLNGSLLFFCLRQSLDWLIYVSPALSFAAAIIGTIQKTLDLQNKSLDNKKSADQYLALCRKIDLVIAHHQDGVINDEKLAEQSDEIRKCYDEIAILASNATTSHGDYKKAQKGINAGEEHYTDKELSMHD